MHAIISRFFTPQKAVLNIFVVFLPSHLISISILPLVFIFLPFNTNFKVGKKDHLSSNLFTTLIFNRTQNWKRKIDSCCPHFSESKDKLNELHWVFFLNIVFKGHTGTALNPWHLTLVLTITATWDLPEKVQDASLSFASKITRTFHFLLVPFPQILERDVL